MACEGSSRLRSLLLYMASVLFVPLLHGTVSVVGVSFSWAQAPGVEGDWLEFEIELREESGTGSSESPERFSSHVEVSLKVSFREAQQGANDFSFYEASAKLVALESGKRARIYFYLPPEIVRRDRLSREPFAWLVSLSVGGQPQPNEPSQYSRSLADSTVARSFLSRVAAEGPANDGILLPIYLTPFYQRESGRLRSLPSFVREDSGRSNTRKEAF